VAAKLINDGAGRKAITASKKAPSNDRVFENHGDDCGNA
jgi:hypothetical protein